MRAIKQRLKLTKKQYALLKEYCWHSRALYNSALHLCTEYFNEGGGYLGYENVQRIMSLNYHYKAIPAMIAQQILRRLDQNFRSFFKLLKLKNEGKYSEDICSPKYLRGREYNLILDNTRVYPRDGKLKITKDLRIPFSYKIPGDIRQTEIISRGGKYYELVISYQERPKEKMPINNRWLSIDLGVNNFATTCACDGASFILNGKPLKSYNRHYNQRVARAKSALDQTTKQRWSNFLSRITNNRANWMNSVMHQFASMIVKYCLAYDIREVICGYNKEWKREVNMGTVNNQDFVNIPYRSFISKLATKCENAGLTFAEVNEAYSSKCSFCDEESVGKHENYLGKRIYRGLFKTARNLLVNADSNGAGNIGKKYLGSRFRQPSMGGIVTPAKFNFFDKPWFVENQLAKLSV